MLQDRVPVGVRHHELDPGQTRIEAHDVGGHAVGAEALDVEVSISGWRPGPVHASTTQSTFLAPSARRGGSHFTSRISSPRQAS